MNIKKIGHCCLLIKTGGLTILTDPGTYTVEQNSITGIDVVLITHEHADHLHVESVQAILKTNPSAKVITNTAVGKVLSVANVPFTVLDGTSTTVVAGVTLEAFDGRHEEIFEEIGQVQNTGYFIDNRLFYPGDSFHNPGKPVEILALPISGPWCRIAAAIRYALDVNPKKAFPVHDFNLKTPGMSHKAPHMVLAGKGIEFVVMVEGEERGF